MERLLQQRPDSRGQRGEELVRPGGDDDHRERRPSSGETTKDVPAALLAKFHVQQHQIGRRGVGGLQCFRAIGGGLHAVPFVSQHPPQDSAHGRIIVHY